MSIDWLFGGILGTPLGGILGAPLYQSQLPLWGDYYAQLEKQNRERFYRSCSQNWLNAMIDVELGI